MFWKNKGEKKEEKPFKIGDQVSNGKRRVVVKRIFKNNNGVWSFLGDEYKHMDNDWVNKFSEEFYCSEFYKTN